MAAIPLPLIMAGAQALTGGVQSLFSGRKKAQREPDALGNKMPVYSGNKSIADYFQESQNRYNENLLNNPVYIQAKQNADRIAATALGGLQGRGGASATAARLAGIQNEGLMGAATEAQRMKDQRFRELGSATGMKAGDDRMMFQSQVDRFNRQDMLVRQKAAAANQRFDAGLRNVMGGLGTAALMGGDLKIGGGKKTIPNLPDTKLTSLPKSMQIYRDFTETAPIEEPSVPSYMWDVNYNTRFNKKGGK